MKTRIITGTLIGLVVAGFFGLRFVSPYLFDILIGIIMLFGAGEVSKVFNRSGKHNNMTLATMFPVALFISILLGIYFELSFGLVLLIELGVLLLFVLAVFIWTIFDKKSKLEEKPLDEPVQNYVLKKVAMTTAIYAYPSIILSMLFYINHIQDLKLVAETTANVGLFMLIALFVTTMLTDVCAYFVGSTFKGKKLCPYISPNKTISGAIGGLAGALVGSVLLYFVFMNLTGFADLFVNAHFSIWIMLVYALFASVLSQAGDIFASWLKRTARTKDFSTIFPGHGGFMDRCDGLAFNAVFTFIMLALIF